MVRTPRKGLHPVLAPSAEPTTAAGGKNSRLTTPMAIAKLVSAALIGPPARFDSPYVKCSPYGRSFNASSAAVAWPFTLEEYCCRRPHVRWTTAMLCEERISWDPYFFFCPGALGTVQTNDRPGCGAPLRGLIAKGTDALRNFASGTSLNVEREGSYRSTGSSTTELVRCVGLRYAHSTLRSLCKCLGGEVDHEVGRNGVDPQEGMMMMECDSIARYLNSAMISCTKTVSPERST